MFRGGFATKAGQDKSAGSAVRRQQGLVGALDLSVCPLPLAICVHAFSYFSNNLRTELHSSLCMLFDLIPSICWHSAVGGSEALEGYRFPWSIVQHCSRFQLVLRCFMVTVQVFISALQVSACRASPDDTPWTVPLHLTTCLPCS